MCVALIISHLQINKDDRHTLINVSQIIPTMQLYGMIFVIRAVNYQICKIINIFSCD